MIYAFREALAQIVDEGLDLFKLRHVENAHRLREGLQNIGLELFVENPEQRMYNGNCNAANDHSKLLSIVEI